MQKYGSRTNNVLEGYNSKLKRLIGSNPHFWKFVKAIKDEDMHEEVRYHRAAVGIKDRRRNKCDTDRDLKITQNSFEYANGQLTLGELLTKQASLVIDKF